MGRKGSEGITKSIRFPKWMAEAMQEIADKNSLTFTEVVHNLLRQELKEMSYNTYSDTEKKDVRKSDNSMKIQTSEELLERIKAAKVPAGWGEEADSSFARFLIIAGLSELEMCIKVWEKENVSDGRLRRLFVLGNKAKNGVE